MQCNMNERVAMEEAKTVIIKKYPNRRLYDTERSAYVTLEDVSKMIQAGDQVSVVDVKSDQDVTSFILTQIIMEKTKKNNLLLPVPLLHLIIRFGEDALGDFFENYLEQIIQNYLTYRKNMEEQLKLCMALGMDFSNMAEMTMKQLAPPFFPPFFNSGLTIKKTDRKG